jgi:hypothetical protein
MRHRTGRALRRRYGRASGDLRVVHHTPMGGLVWAVPGSSYQIMWAGPGARLKLGEIMKPGGMVTTIEHPAAARIYDNPREATKAVRKFLRV